jgi:hypothetical protein
VTPSSAIQEPASHRRIRLTVWGVAIVTALFAVGQTTANLALGHYEATSANLAKAERRLLHSGLSRDWQWLLKSGMSAGTTVSEWIDTVELANLQRRQFYDELSEDLFRGFVLSPQVMSGWLLRGDLRRELWRYFAPRVRKESDVTKGAAIIAQELRIQVTSNPNAAAVALLLAWQRGEAHPDEWEALYIAALRSAGVAARIGDNGRAQVWVEKAWQDAPRPLQASSL